MSVEEKEIVLLLDGTQFDTAIEETIPPGSLVQSLNTRLTKEPGAPTCAPESADLASLGSTVVCGGIVPVGAPIDSSIAYLRGSQKRIVGSQVADVTSTISSTQGQNAYFPVQVIQSGSPFNSYIPHAPAVVEYAGLRIFAAPISQANGNYSIYVTVLSTDGALLVPQTLVANTGLPASGVFPCFVGLTTHDNQGIRLWYNKGGTIYGRSLAVSGLSLTLGTETAIYTPHASSMAYQVAICSGGTGNGDADYAWIISVNSANVNDVTLSRIDIQTYALSSVTFAGVGGASVRVAIAETNDGTGSYLAVVIGNTAASSRRCYDGRNMTLRWPASAGPAGVESVAASFYAVFGTFAQISAFCIETATIGSTAARTEFHFNAASSGSSISSTTRNWVRLQSRGAFYRASATDITPFFLVHQTWGANGGINSDVEDPALHVITTKFYGSGWSITPLARLGVDLAKLGGNGSFFSHASSEPIYADAGGKLIVSYLTSRNPTAFGSLGDLAYFCRYVVMDFAEPGQAPYAIDDSGVAIIAAAQPAYWDGAETVEYGPLHKPKMRIDATGGTGPNLTGTYNFRACFVWRDRTGQLRRSEPSLPVTITPAGTKPKIWVPQLFTMRDGYLQEAYDVEIYATATGSTEYVLQDYLVAPTAAGCTVFDYITDPSYSAKRRLYSTGTANTELFPVAPGALWDVAIVNNRAWAIDAENRKRALYSKQKVNSAVAHEFGGGFTEVLFPASAGTLIGVEESDGNAVFFTSEGIFMVFGEGPNNQGAGTRFAAPRKISDVQCTSRESIIRTPVGVMFQAGPRFALLAGGSVKIFPEIEALEERVCQAVLFKEFDEVVFVAEFGNTKVFNYALGRWTEWNIGRQQAAAIVPATGVLLSILDANTTTSLKGALQRTDPDSASTTTARRIHLEMPWTAPEGPQGTCTFRELVFQGFHGLAHGVTFTIYYDYREDNPTVVAFTAAEVSQLEIYNRYTLAVRLVQGEARAIKIVIDETESSGSAMRPLSLTLCYGVEPGHQRRAVRRFGLK